MSEDHLPPPPLEQRYDLARLGQAGDEVCIEASPEDRQKLARWLDIPSVERFTAKIGLKRRAQDRFDYDAVLEAELTQSCVVTLQPVASRHELHIRRSLNVISRMRRQAAAEEKGGILTLAAGDDDAPEEIEGYRYDLLGPLLEELSLDLDPYPRAPGVEFTPPTAPGDEKENPFAALARLRQGK